MNPVFYNHPYLQTETVVHGFFGRRGGVSGGIYQGLNCGAGSYDNAGHVSENRQRALMALGLGKAPLSTLYQVHSPNVVILNAPISGKAPQADALVSDVAGIALGILTADCAPVMFADARAGVIGIAHAGWKGAHGGVLENTVHAMEKLGAMREHISAVVGPCIAQASYEVGPEFVARFTADEQVQFFLRSSKTAGHSMFDLPGYVVARLRETGIGRMAVLGHDTCTQEADFFSYRRATLREEPDYGRQISIIALRK